MASAWNNKQTSGRHARTRDWSWWQVLKRTVAEFRADNVTDWAAALTYYAVLSIFPALIALISVVGLLGSSATNSLLTNLQAFTPGPAKDILTNAVTGLSKNRSAGGIMFVVGLGVALWSASGYVAAFMRAANAIWDAPEGRPIWKTLPVRVGVTVITVMVIAIGAVAVVVTGPIAQRVGDLLGLGSAAVTAWDVAKWPALVVLFGLLLFDSLLRSAQRHSSRVSVGHTRRRARDHPMDRSVSSVRALRRHIRLLQQDLRRARRGDRVSDLALGVEHLHPSRRRVRCRTGPRIIRSKPGSPRIRSPTCRSETDRRLCR